MKGKVQEDPYSVSLLTAEIKGLLEKNFTLVFVEGEISGMKISPPGHAYFTLKDEGAVLSCVMFASARARCKARDGLKNGAKVLLYGTVSVYGPHGNYQLNVKAARLAGVGDLMRRFEELKAKLAAEGLFDRSRKRPLPFLPRRIGLVTSEAGAVVHDMCKVLTRRFPNLEIRLFPCLVQGDAAPATIIAGIRYFNEAAADTWPADLLIVGRGGGSFEDLFCFNDEALVRALAASKIPTISAVGHETDYTLCDFVADMRAGTPSMAAELAVPEKDELETRLAKAASTMTSALRAKGEWSAQRLDQLSDALAAALEGSALKAERRLASAAARLAPSVRVASAQAERRLASVSARLAPASRLALARDEARLEKAAAKLALLSPFGVLERGYSIVTDDSGAVVTDASRLAPGARLATRFRTGTAESVVERVTA